MTQPSGEMTPHRAYPELITPEESQLLMSMLGPPETHRARERVIRAGEVLDSSLYLVSGFMGRFSCDRLGRRQFVALQIPGDYIDLPAYLLKSLEHDIDSLGGSTARRTPHAGFDMIGEDYPHLYRKLWRITMIDSAIQRYWIFRVGRLAGRARLANFFCEMFLRLFARGLADATGYPLPVSQADLAEICGVTPVHVNRLLADLRLDNICTLANGRLEILDLEKMFRVGDHSRAYLYLPESVEEKVAALIGSQGARDSLGSRG